MKFDAQVNRSNQEKMGSRNRTAKQTENYNSVPDDFFFSFFVQIQNGLIVEIGQGKGAVNNNKIHNALALPNGQLC